MDVPVCTVKKERGVPAVFGALVSLTGGNDTYFSATITDGARRVREVGKTAAEAEAKAWAKWRK